ncbi:MAG: hypothetical protein JST82_04235 [Bacteroidetes bacterium]|nr:hypothetical protein [Bacteroidota bacterium]
MIKQYKAVYPLQYFGIGDIIFTQTLVRAIAGTKPICWGVLPQFVDGLKRAYQNIEWLDYRCTGVNYETQTDCIVDDKRLLPIRWADSILNLPYEKCMSAKYILYNVDWRLWKESAQWKRDQEREDVLFQNIVGKNTKYNLINNTFGSDNQFMINICPDNALPNVEMKAMPGFSIFDWAKVIEQATEIHTVSTSIVYMLELLPIYVPIHLYPRKPIENDLRNVDYLLKTHKYHLHS